MHSRSRLQQAQDRAAALIAQTARHLRAQRSWTLDELAARSGISRRLIVQIEQAEANPSIGTLLRLADAFDVTLSELLAEPQVAPFGVHRRADALQLWSGPRGGAGQLLVNRGPLELWSWTLAPGESHHSDAHRAASIELFTVTRGTLQIDIGSESFVVNARNSAWFEPTAAHTYTNPTRSTTAFTLVVFEP